MRVFFDNCTSPVLAGTLNGFLRSTGGGAIHIKDVAGLPKGRDSADLEWIEFLRTQPEEWIFITGDGRVLRNRPERLALRSAGLHGFILMPGYQKMPLNEAASLLLWKWPEIEKIVGLLASPSMHEVNVGRGTKLSQLLF